MPSVMTAAAPGAGPAATCLPARALRRRAPRPTWSAMGRCRDSQSERREGGPGGAPGYLRGGAGGRGRGRRGRGLEGGSGRRWAGPGGAGPPVPAAEGVDLAATSWRSAGTRPPRGA